MQATGRRDTKPELALRSALHSHGLRYVVDQRPVPTLNRRADLLFTRARLAVFVDGCFWHGCPEHGTTASTNRVWWTAKIAKNKARDAHTDTVLESAGWQVVRLWEHEIRDDLDAAMARVTAALYKASAG
jgi:DNA mismatch endonuclease (patch repair protein)